MLLQWENFSPANLAGEPGRLTAYGGEIWCPASVSVTCPRRAHWHGFSLFMLDFILAFLSMSERDVISRRRAFCYFPSFNTNPSIIFLVCLDAEEFFREVASPVGCGMRSSAYWESFFFLEPMNNITSHHIKNLLLHLNAEKVRQKKSSGHFTLPNAKAQK